VNPRSSQSVTAYRLRAGSFCSCQCCSASADGRAEPIVSIGMIPGKSPRRAAVPAPRCRTVNAMSAQPSGPVDGHDVIRLGDETAVVVPMHEYRTLKALRDRASAGELDDAEIEATIAEHKEWVAAGRPGEMTHEEAMARLLADRLP
jgi:hypothetical protein